MTYKKIIIITLQQKSKTEMGYANVDFVYPLDFNKIHSVINFKNIISAKALPETLNIESRLSSLLPQVLVAGKKL